VVRKWVQPMIRKAKQKGTLGIFKRKAQSLGVSTKTLANRWKGKPGVWGKRARAALNMMNLPRPSRTARQRGAKKAARTRASRGRTRTRRTRK
jgi:hypothetical protein